MNFETAKPGMDFYTSVHILGNKAYVRGVANGRRYNEDLDCKPFLFIKGEGPYRTLEGYPCYKKTFDTVREARDFSQQYENVENFTFYGMTNFLYPFINENYPGKIEYDPNQISIVYLDIECKSTAGMPDPYRADQEITAITIMKDDQIVTFGIKHYRPEDKNVHYIMCKDEKDLLNKFLTVWDDWQPDIVSSWNGDMFDIPYLYNRLKNILGEKAAKCLSPWRIVTEREIVRAKTTAHSTNSIEKRTEMIYEIAGISQLDYLQLYKKFTNVNHESYRLDNIAHAELNERKLDYTDFDNLDDFYDKDPARYYEYNIHDCVLVKKLEDKLGFIKQVVALAYQAKINYIDAFTTTKPWDVIIHNYLLEKNIVIPQQKNKMDRELIGAYVHEPQIGLHKNVVTLDFKGLYPSIISQANISPETFVRGDFNVGTIEQIINSKAVQGAEIIKTNNWSVCANRCVYRKDIRGFIPAIVDLYIEERDKHKKEMIDLQKLPNPSKETLIKIGQLDSFQASLKILNNGLYGSLSNKYFRWFDINLAESVTTTGQLCIKWIMYKLNEYLNPLLKTEGKDYVIAGDTDSVILNLDPLVQKMNITDPMQKINFLDSVCKHKLEPLIKQACEELAQVLNSYNNAISIKREIIADKAIWRKAKNYVLNVWDKEGVRYNEPKLVLKGIEAVRSSTPMQCRNQIKEALKIIMQKDEKTLQNHIVAFEKIFMNSPILDIAFPRGVDGLDHYYDPVFLCKKATPIHVRGALVYNNFLREHKLEKNFKFIQNKDKIRFMYLKEPNPFKSHVIAIPDEGNLPKELEIEQYVDRHMQWDKAFISPIRSFTSLINWNLEKRTTMDAFFV